MTIRFAAAWGGTTPAIARALCTSAPLGACNDNRRPLTLACRASRAGEARPGPSSPHIGLPVEALRHFARYGLAAAVKARDEAEKAAALGDSGARDRWLTICGQLDRRMAEACRRRFAGIG